MIKNSTRTKMIGVRVSPEEKQMIEVAAALRGGQSVPSFIRWCVQCMLHELRDKVNLLSALVCASQDEAGEE